MPVTLHYDFGTDKSLTAKVGPDLSITRATSATYVDDAGEIATATSGVARFTHDKDGNSLGLLVEEARTNIQTYSEEIDNAVWQYQGITINADAATAPDGTTTADRLNIDATNSNHIFYENHGSLTADQNYCWSGFFKDDGQRYLTLTLTDNTEDFIAVSFDLTTISVTQTDVGTTSGTIVGYDIEDYGNGWYRCWIAGSKTATSTFAVVKVHNTATPALGSNGYGPTYTATEGEDMFAWGMQLEEGKFPTSYIPTTTASVTRNFDDVSTSDMTWWTADSASSLFTDATINHDVGDESMIVTYGTGLTNEVNHGLTTVAEQGRVETKKSGGNSGIVPLNGRYVAFVPMKQVSGFDQDDLACYWNGTAGVADTSCDLLSTANFFRVGAENSTPVNPWNGVIKEIAYFDERLANADLSDLSDGTKTVASFSGTHNYIAITRRTAGQMGKNKRRMTRTKRGTLFE